MRRMILRMIATGSLSAFSSSALPALPSQAARGAGGGGAVQQARATQAQPVPQIPLDPGRTSGQPSSRTTPRGSLLDLSV
jgi:hypothetical protein